MKTLTAVARFNRLKAITRLLVCLGLAATTLVILLYFHLQILTSIVLAWLVFSLGMIVVSWITFFTVNNIDNYLQAKEEDESGPVIFSLVLLSVCLSVAGILILMGNADPKLIAKGLHRLVSLLSVGLSWVLLHTIFTLHYAAEYYKDDPAGKKPQAGGLDFPGDTPPDYLDFAYFSFVIGMTFQVSDVEISSRHLRKLRANASKFD